MGVSGEDEEDSEDGDDDDDVALSPEEVLTNRRIEEALAIVSRTRGIGIPGKWVEQEAPVEEFVIRGRRVLVKRDDQVRIFPGRSASAAAGLPGYCTAERGRPLARRSMVVRDLAIAARRKWLGEGFLSEVARFDRLS